MPSSPSRFIDVYLEPCAAAPEGLSMRFKCAGEAQPVRTLLYESELGLGGAWRVFAADDDTAFGVLGQAFAVPVEDSSDGTAWLVVGGRAGLALEHAQTGTALREPYLMLSKTTELS